MNRDKFMLSRWNHNAYGHKRNKKVQMRGISDLIQSRNRYTDLVFILIKFSIHETNKVEFTINHSIEKQNSVDRIMNTSKSNKGIKNLSIFCRKYNEDRTKTI